MGLHLRHFFRGAFLVIFLFALCWCANQHVAEETSEAATLPVRPSAALIGAQWWVFGRRPLLLPPPPPLSLFLSLCRSTSAPGSEPPCRGSSPELAAESRESGLDFRLIVAMWTQTPPIEREKVSFRATFVELTEDICRRFILIFFLFLQNVRVRGEQRVSPSRRKKSY